MPTISRFYGIIIQMFYDDHNPPHFHADYQGKKGKFDLEGNFVEGDLPPKQIKYVSVWADIHKNELIENWELAKAKKEPLEIEPLK